VSSGPEASVRLESVAYDARDPERLARFWGDLLGRRPAADAHGVLLAGTETQVGLRFVESPAPVDHAVRRLHLHLTSADAADQARIVARVLELGGTHLDVGQLPEEEHVVLADPEGNELCVIEPGNGFLAGCGPLAEVACDGSREVGVFWSSALGWPLVWDEGEETAVQSPAGGTKVAWGGLSDVPKAPRNQQRFVLVADDPDVTVERLVGLGAVRLDGPGQTRRELADPDGNEFTVR
jgi:predicted enzyme related to lactoylglutathione lyase